MTVSIEKSAAERAGETEWIDLVTDIVRSIDSIDEVLIWSDQARFHFDAGAYDEFEVVKAVQEAFRERRDETALVSGGTFAYIQDVDGHTNTKEIRARNPF